MSSSDEESKGSKAKTTNPTITLQRLIYSPKSKEVEEELDSLILFN